MQNSEFWILIVAFVLPSLIYRISYHLNPESFHETPLRKALRLNIHHGVWGVLWMAVAGAGLCFGAQSIFIKGAFFFGLGLVFDEIVPLLLSPGQPRREELYTYKVSLRPTIILILSAICLFAFMKKLI